MKYHITIDDRFWAVKHPEWNSLDAQEQTFRMKRFVEELQDFLNTGDGGESRSVLSAKRTDLLADEVMEFITIREVITTEGVALIQAERNEQLNKHGYDAAHDDTLQQDQLVDAAVALITEDPERWPQDMDRAVFNTASEKDTVGRLAVAGAFIAAELDRLLRARQHAEPTATHTTKYQ